MWRARYVLSLACVLCSLCQEVRAEGSAEFDVADGLIPMSRAHDQAVDGNTAAYVDVLDGANEKICYRGDSSSLSVYRPRPNQAMLVGTINNNQCVNAVDGVDGAYVLNLATQTLGTEWDIRVCDKSVSNVDCLTDASNEKLGRLWSYDWSFQSNLNYGRDYSINGSIYAIVPGGADDHDAVIEMQMRGVSGARYHLFANSFGPESGSGTRIGRSARTGEGQTNRVTPEFPIYLNPPAIARYNWVEPVVKNVKVEPECGTAVVSEVAPGAISFESNVIGQYVVICDVNRDDVYNFADNADFSSFGQAVVGMNTVLWDGRSKGGAYAPAGEYKCVIRLNVGEFHFMAEDIETADPGIRMFRVEKEQDGARARTPLKMFWDDSLIPNDNEPISSVGRPSPNGAPPEGLDPGAYEDPFLPYHLDGTTPTGTSRAWGNYDADGKGNDSFLDQFTSAATVESTPVTIAVMTREGDPDNDGLSTLRECELRSDPRSADTDGDNVHDGFEASASDAPDSDDDGVLDILDNDDDGDGVPTRDELGADENGDGQPDDARDADDDGIPDYLDQDSDGDSVPDGEDIARDETTRCGDSDDDGCDDCSGGQGPDPANDGPDSDGDGRCDAADKVDAGTSTSEEEPILDAGAPKDLDAAVALDAGAAPNEVTDSDGGMPDASARPNGEDRDADAGDSLQPPSGSLVGGALCSVTSPGAPTQSTNAWLFAGGLFVLLWLRRARGLLGFLALCTLLALTQAARAQVALDQFKPAPLASDGFAVSRPDVSGHMVLGTTLWIDYANDPLVYEFTRGDSTTQERVVRDHLVLHAGLSLGLGDRVTLFALLPIHLVMKGESGLTLPNTSPEGAGLGDLALGARVRLLGDPRSTAALSGELIARVPSAELANGDQRYSGDAVGSYEPALIGEVRAGPFDVRLRAGARLRKSVQVGNLELDQELVYGAGARLHLGKLFSLHAEAYGSTFFKDPFARAYSPLELLAGGKLRAGDFVFGVAAGPGLLQGYGSPDVRVVGLLGYAPEPESDADSDGDGLRDSEDKCPNQSEDRDDFEDDDGCPDPDNDRDGIPDVSDQCPRDPEDKDQFEDDDGCADPDNDRDGVPDSADKCPNEPEDRDSFQDDDGCPDEDNDRDSVPDSADKCPDEPEDRDGFEDDDGCPEEGSVKVTCDRIEIKEAVYFDTDADTIQERSFALLDQLAEKLRQAEHVKRVRIEGHTDDRGRPEYNRELSKRRAASVLRYLREHGVSANRLESEGYGVDKPIADNDTEQGRARNRRVEFIVAEQSADCAK